MFQAFPMSLISQLCQALIGSLELLLQLLSSSQLGFEISFLPLL